MNFDTALSSFLVSVKILVAGLGYYAGRAKLLTLAKQIIFYWSGLISQQGRLKYEEATTKYRPYEQMRKYDEMREMISQDPSIENLIYNSYSLVLPESVIRGLNRAADNSGPVPLQELKEAALRARLSNEDHQKNLENGTYADDPYWLFSADQILFFDDQTLEPVLVNFIRIKNKFRKVGLKQKDQKLKAAETKKSLAGQQIPGMALEQDQ